MRILLVEDDILLADAWTCCAAMGQENGAGFAERIFGSLAGQVRQLTGGAGDCQVLGS